jgi:hypothetical protein
MPSTRTGHTSIMAPAGMSAVAKTPLPFGVLETRHTEGLRVKEIGLGS